MDDLNKLGYSLGLRAFDTALPQDWVNAQLDLFERETGVKIYHLPFGIVWCYDGSMWGEPVALTIEAKRFFKHQGINSRVEVNVGY